MIYFLCWDSKDATPNPIKVKPQNNQNFQKPRSQRIGLTFLLILVSILAAGIFIFRNSLNDLFSKRGLFYTVVLDCGSTGTRVNVYNWMVTGSSGNGGNLPVLLHSFPENFGESHGCQYHCVQTMPGLDKFVGNATGVRVALEPLIRLAEKWVPLEKHRATPIIVHGTAGMRALSSEEARQVLEDVEKILKEHKFLCKKEWIRVLSGKEEGYFGWIALNYEMGMFHNRSMSSTLGLLDLGGSSLQVVTEVDELGEDEHAFISKFGSFQHYIAAYSLQGFGFSEAFDRTVAMLSYSPAAIGESWERVIEIRHPCMRYGSIQNYTCLHCRRFGHVKSESISTDTEGTNSNSWRLVGGSNWEECKVVAAAAAVNSSIPVLSQQDAHSDCKGFSVHGGSRKLNLTAQSHSDRQFFALSGFFAVYKKLNISVGANFRELKQTGEHLCQNLSADPNGMSGQDCFQVAYMVSLIEDALCLGNVNISFGPSDISWTLGAALIQGDYLWLSSAESRSVVSRLRNREVMFSSPVIVFVLLSCLLFAVYRSQIKIPMLGRKTATC